MLKEKRTTIWTMMKGRAVVVPEQGIMMTTLLMIMYVKL